MGMPVIRFSDTPMYDFVGSLISLGVFGCIEVFFVMNAVEKPDDRGVLIAIAVLVGTFILMALAIFVGSIKQLLHL